MLERGLAGRLVALSAEFFKARQLGFPHCCVVHLQDIYVWSAVVGEQVHTNDLVSPGIDPSLLACSGLLDAELGQAVFNGGCHASQFFNFLDVRPGLVQDLARQTFDIF